MGKMVPSEGQKVRLRELGGSLWLPPGAVRQVPSRLFGHRLMGLGTVFGLEKLRVLAGAAGENTLHSWTFQRVPRFSLVRILTAFKCDHLFSSLTLNLDWFQALNWWVEPLDFSSLPTSCCLKRAPFSSAEGSRVGAKQRGNLQKSFEARWALKVCRADEVTLPETSNEGLRSNTQKVPLFPYPWGASAGLEMSRPPEESGELAPA